MGGAHSHVAVSKALRQLKQVQRGVRKLCAAERKRMTWATLVMRQRGHLAFPLIGGDKARKHLEFGSILPLSQHANTQDRLSVKVALSCQFSFYIYIYESEIEREHN